MSSYVNTEFDLANSETKVIPVNRWSWPNYAIQVSGGSALVEGTLNLVNRGETPVWSTLNTAVTGFEVFEGSPLEAVKITATGATTGRIMQQGGS
jgi:hypothetical protein